MASSIRIGEHAAVSGELGLYRLQHLELRAAVVALGAALDRLSSTTAPAPGATRTLLSRLAGKLTVHLQMEDRSLYPELLRSRSAAVRETALRFQEEMGSIGARASLLFRKWLAEGAIDSAPREFAAEARPVLHALIERIGAEDAELFPLADRGE
jgi:hypothetical protein